ncbi:hypothetical protein P3T76_014634 [Phytophthora citrophthora]|uniref:Uncharacterized protein n=1 Tax=Phytophthora citrophthora TaxID=4793 RepID=A0AAD9G1B4_9STRA|nr:hypothetical protein P3T76_014634 [Phytophthora citrophthora]
MHQSKQLGQSKYSSAKLRTTIREFVIATRPVTAQIIANHVAKVMDKKTKIPSYVNINHAANKTWLTEDKDGSTTRSQDEIHGSFVGGSIEHWNSASKKRKEAMEPTDYHGNFDSEKFDLWFTNLRAVQYSHGWSFISQVTYQPNAKQILVESRYQKSTTRTKMS